MSAPASPPIVRQTVVVNAHGIHCRPSAMITRAAQECPDNRFRIVAPNGETDLRSVIGLIGLGIECNSPVTVEVSGPDADAVADRFCELFATHFDFPPKDAEATSNPTTE
jgi:phosphotransferase system HPr (HPr) family protein